MLEIALSLSLMIAMAGGARFRTVTNAITAVGFYGMSFILGWSRMPAPSASS